MVSVEAKEIIPEGRKLAKLHRNVVVKVPLIPEGLKAVKVLSSDGIRVNVTLCFSAVQALMAAKAGAYIISPFIGRLDDIASNGMDLIRNIARLPELRFPDQDPGGFDPRPVARAGCGARRRPYCDDAGKGAAIAVFAPAHR